MIEDKWDLLHTVNQVMADMFYLLPDVDDLGRQKIGGPVSAEGEVVVQPVDEDRGLQFVYDKNLLMLMGSNLTALPPDELPMDWIRQLSLDAIKICWGRHLTVNDKKGEYPFPAPYSTDRREDITGARWHFNYISESHTLSVSLIEQANL